MNKFQRFIARTARTFLGSAWDDYTRAFLRGDDLPDIAGSTYVDSDTAMKYTAVFACNRVLSETVATVPAMLYRKLDNGDRETRNDLAIYDILHNQPNEEMTPFSWKEASMTAINLGGNAVSERLVNASGDLVGLYHYEWPRVEIDRDPETNKLRYTIRQGANAPRVLSREQVFHLPGPSFNGIVGLTPLEYVGAAIRLGLSYQQFGLNFYRNAANASGAFTTPGELTEEAYQRLKVDLEKSWSGLQNTGKPMILEGGTGFVPFTIKPADAQLIENKRFQLSDVARVYRVPLHLIQDLDRATNNNIEHQSLEFVMYTMLPWFRRWEEAINMQLLTRRERQAGFYVEFKLDVLLRGDAKSRSEAYAYGRQWGWLSVNDIRRLENMPPIENGDIYLQPMNYVEAGKVDSTQADQSIVADTYRMITGKGGGLLDA